MTRVGSAACRRARAQKGVLKNASARLSAPAGFYAEKRSGDRLRKQERTDRKKRQRVKRFRRFIDI